MLTTDEKSSLLYKHYLGVGESRITRDFFEEALKSSIIVQPSSLWTYGDLIPGEGFEKETIDRIRQLGNGDVYSVEIKESKIVDVVKRHIDVPLTKIDNGTDNAFKIEIDGVQLKNIIPFNFYEDVYLYNLKTSSGEKIYFGAGDWLVDTHSGVLTFYGDLPDGVDHDHPPLLSFFEYVGGNGFKIEVPGLDSIVLPIYNISILENLCSFNDDSLKLKIENAADDLIDDFTSLYNWDGSDDGPGIATVYEKIVPVVYSSTKNNVFAFEESGESQVYSLISNKSSNHSSIVFTSQKAPEEYILRKIGDGYSIEDGSVFKADENGFAKVYSKDGSWWIVVEHLDDNPEELTVLTSAKPSMVLLYWDEKLNEYKPWTADENIEINTGIPIVCYANTIPPSVQLNQVTLSSFNDTISPDYYGPRVATVIIASEDSVDNKSADYIVKNAPGHDLVATFEKIIEKYPSFQGKIILRTGNYVCDGDLDVSLLGRAIIEGESGVLSTVINGNIVATKECFITLNNLQVGNIDITAGTVLLNQIYPNDINISGDTTAVHIRDCFPTSIIVNERNLQYADYIIIDNCQTHSLQIKSDRVIVRNNILLNLSIEAENNVYIESNTIVNLLNKPQKVIVDPNNYVMKFSENIDKTEFPSDMSFPLYHVENDRRFTNFGHDFPVKYSQENNEIELCLHHERIIVNEDGLITTIIKPKFMEIDKETLSLFKRHPSSELATPSPETPNLPKDEVTGENTITNLEDALKDIYYSKADLYNGKVPMEQLPDSIAYGGLLYVGNWSFEKSNGRYPTFQDVVDMGIMDRLSRDENVSEMQPGWFFIIDKSVTSTHKVENINKHVYEASPSYPITISFDSKGKSFRLFIDKTKGPDECIKLFWSDDNYTNHIAAYKNVDFNEDGILWDSLQVPEGSTNTADYIGNLLPWSKTLGSFTFAWRGDDVTLNGALVKIEGLSLEENDDPVKEQYAVDGRIYTAGDWLIFTGIEGSKSFFEKSSVEDVELQGQPVFFEDKTAGKNLTDDFKRLFTSPGKKADLITSDGQVYRLENVDNQIIVKYGNILEDGTIEFDDEAEVLDQFNGTEVSNIITEKNAEIYVYDNKLSEVVFLSSDDQIEITYNDIDITPVNEKSYTPTYIFNFATNKAKIRTPIYYDVAIVENFVEYEISEYNSATGKFKLSLNINEEILDDSTKNILEQFGSSLEPSYISEKQVQFPLLHGISYQYSITQFEDGLKLENESLELSEYLEFDILSNANNWEKIDRSYDDPVYSVLPSHTASRNSPNIPWHWRDGGLGAEDLGNQTIVEALDTLNKSIKKLEPKKPLAARHTSFKLVDEDKITSFREFINGRLVNKQGYDKNDETISFKVTTGEKGRDTGFYLGDSAQITIDYNGQSLFKSRVPTGANLNVPIGNHTFKIDTTSDIYDDELELYGKENFWKAGFIESSLNKDHLEETIRINFSVDGIRPDVAENLSYNSHSQVLSFNTYKPLSYENGDYDNLEITAKADPNWNFDANNNYVNGVRYILPTAKLKFSNLVIKNVSNKYINNNGIKVHFYSDYDESHRVELTGYSIEENENGYIDFKKSEIEYTLTNKTKFYDKLNFFVDFEDFYGNLVGTYQCCSMDVIVSNIPIDKRVVKSGLLQYPKHVGPLVECGKPIVQGNKLSENEFELQKTIIVDDNGDFDSIYKWPSGEWTYNIETISYEGEKYKKGLPVGDNEYRFITYDTGIELFEASGFVIRVTTDDDNWTRNLYTGSTNGALFQACLVTDSDTPDYWFDCNSPIGPFSKLDPAQSFGIPSMFAGSSSSVEKRVSFGRSVASGRLYVRIGITSEKTIRNVEVVEVI